MNDPAIRTQSYRGYVMQETVGPWGYTHILVGDPHGTTRMVRTSTVQSVDAAAGTFQTLNSTYGWEEVAA